MKRLKLVRALLLSLCMTAGVGFSVLAAEERAELAESVASGVIDIDVAGTTERLQTLQSAL